MRMYSEVRGKKLELILELKHQGSNIDKKKWI